MTSLNAIVAASIAADREREAARARLARSSAPAKRGVGRRYLRRRRAGSELAAATV
jgi:hypothetical protein